jgi:hypothetical protein
MRTDAGENSIAKLEDFRIVTAMTNEERANWIRRGIILFIAVAIVLGVMFYPKKPAPPPKAKDAIEAVHDIEILHFHQPKNPESEQIAASLKKIADKYGKQILVTTVDIVAEPERAKAEKVTAPPKVVMMAGAIRASKFQGVWTYAQIEFKVEEILRGLKRMGKDWRPDVQGMKPSTGGIPAPGNAPPGTVLPGAAPAKNAFPGSVPPAK